MSMVSTYVESQEGHWYRNPVVKGDGWFICWDDDEPIEIVVEKDKGIEIKTILSQLAKQGWLLTQASRIHSGAMRCFDDSFGPGSFKPALSCFLRQEKFGPTDAMLYDSDRLAMKPRGDGVYYSNSRNGNAQL